MPERKRIRVLLVDDHPVVRRGVRGLLEENADIELVAEVSLGGEAVEEARRVRPDLVLMDVMLPDMSGIEATRAITQKLPQTRILIMSACADGREIFDAIDAGATGYLTKDDEPDVVVHAVRLVAGGASYLSPSVMGRVLTAISGSRSFSVARGRYGGTQKSLTEREIVVLQGMGTGKKNRQIAKELSISERTVGTTIASMYNKLGVVDRAAAVLRAARQGIISIK